MKLKKHLKFWGTLLLYGSFIALCYVFLLAYITPNKITEVSINKNGEANLEFLLLIVSFLIGTTALILSYVEVIHEIIKK